MKARSLRADTLGFALMLGIVALLMFPAPATADPEDLRSALSDYAAGKYEEALEKLRAYVASNPEDNEVYDVLRDVEQRVLLRGLARGGEHERLFKYLLHKSAPAERERLRDADDIKELVTTAVEDSAWDKRRAAASALQASGEHAVQYIYPYLGAANADHVVNAILALRRLSDLAVMPLVEVMASDNPRIRGHAAVVLGDLKDERALPALLYAAEKDPEASVQEKARNAASKLGGGGSAADAYVTMGTRFLNKDPEVLRAFTDMKDVWRWEEGALQRYEVPAYLYGYHVAEEYAADGMQADPANSGANALLVRSLLAQKVEVAAAATKGGEEKAGVLSLFDQLVSSQGLSAESDALRSAIGDKDWEVAVECCHAMARDYAGQPISQTALVDALNAPDQRVRYAASIAALNMNPRQSFPGAERVAEIAARAAARSAVFQVLVADDHVDTQGMMVAALNEAGFVTGSDNDAHSAVNRTKGNASMDVVVIRANIGETAATVPSNRTYTAMSAIDEIKADARTSAVRVLVLVDGPNADKVQEMFQTKYGDKVAGYISPANFAAAAFVDQVNQAAEAGDLNADRAAANRVAAAAANALASVDSYSSAFPNLNTAVGSLAEAAVKGKEEAIQLGAVKALGNIAGGGADALVTALGAGGEDIQAAAAEALGNVLAKVGGAQQGHIEALVKATESDSERVRAAALSALGRVTGNIDPSLRRSIFLKHRAKASALGGGGDSGE